MKRLIVGLFAVLAGFLFQSEQIHGAVEMFWADNGSVFRANGDGTNVAMIYDGVQGQVGWVDVDSHNRKIYMRGGVDADGGAGGVIKRMNYDGSVVEDVLTGLNYSAYGLGLDLANGTMYFGDYPGGIYRANLNGSGLLLLPNTKGDYLYGDVWDNPNLRHTHDMQVVGDKLYYANGEFTQLSRHSHLFAGIRRSDLDGKNIETLVDYSDTVGTGMLCLAIDSVNSKLYWSDDHTDSILRANLDGTGVETFLAGVPAYDLEIDAATQMLYFTTSWDTQYLERIRLDGTGREQLVALSGVNGAKGLALTSNAVPEPASIAVWSLLCIVGIGIIRYRNRWFS